ncbi:choice-of-anchor D domain-containing protein, partial [Urechidicola sp. KH5]
MSAQTLVAQYCTSVGSDNWNAGIRRVYFGNINSISLSDPDYTDYTADTGRTTTLSQGSTYDFNLWLHTGGNWPIQARVWIDWNQDEVFDDVSEAYDLGSTTNGEWKITTASPFGITVPGGAVLGDTRMRVTAQWLGDVNDDPVPCYAADFWGETEDYTVTIQVPQNEITVLGNSEIIRDGDSSPAVSDNTDFGTTSLGNTITKTYTIRNDGSLDLNITNINFAGLHPTAFSIVGVPYSTPVAPGGSTTFQVRYEANMGGIAEANVRIFSDDVDEGTYNFKIQGEADCSTITLTGSSTTAPSSLGAADGTATFGTVTGGTAPYEYSIDGINWFSTTTFTGLQEAPFKFYVRDIFGCLGEDRATGYFNLAAGACVIDMGNDSGTFTPTEANNIEPYGLIYTLVEDFNVPVYWVVNPNKSFVNDSDNGNPNIVNQIDITVTGTTTSAGATPITRNLISGAFVIPEQYLTPTVIAELQSWEAENNTGVNIHWNLNQLDDVPVYGIIKTLANAVIYPLGETDPDRTDIGEAFFEPARIPAASYRVGRIDELNGCDEIYIMGHHTEPDNWPQNEIDLLYDYVLSGGNIWMGCQDVSRVEDIVTSDGEQLNFLTDYGLINYGSHSDVSSANEVAYTISTAGNPIMQFIGEIHPALEGNSEEVYLPKKSAAGGTTGAGGWLPTTVTAIYDTNHSNVGPTNTSNGNAAILAYGPAFGNSLYGTVVYEGSHINSSNAGNAVQHIGERRVFGNYLLTAAIRYQKDAGEDQTYTYTRCGRVSARLNAEQPINGGGVWSIVSGAGGSFADVNNPKSR